MMQQNPEEFYARLKEQLVDSTLWPSEYLYKFIVPTDPNKVKQITDAFDNMGAVIKSNISKTGKFTSVSVNVTMKSAQSVIDKYKQLSVVEGIISL